MLVLGHMHERNDLCVEYSHQPIHEHLSPESSLVFLYKMPEQRDMANQDLTKSV